MGQRPFFDESTFWLEFIIDEHKMKHEDNTKETLTDKSQASNEALRLYAALVRQLYKHAPIGIVATIANSFILTFILWNVIPHSILISWLSATVSISFLRYLSLCKYWRSSPTSAEACRWATWFIIGIALSGIIWGFAGIFLFSVDSIAHQVFLAFVIGGMVAAAAGTFSIIMKAFLAYSLPALAPIIMRFFVIGDDIHLAMGAMGLLFGLLMFFTAKRVNAAIVSSLKLQFENRDLVESLAVEKKRLEILNTEYADEIVQRKRMEEKRKQAEEEKKKLEAQLRQSQKMEAIGTLAGGVAHDFNNLLTVIIGNAQLALMNAGKDESLRKEIGEIKKAGDRAASLTMQLLAFSRKQVIQPEVLDLNELLTGIEKMLARLIREDVELLTIIEPALWQVEVDPGQMEQAIMNLAINARDAMSTCADSAAGRPRGGKLTIETANIDLRESYFHKHGIEEKPGSYVMLTVSDTGSGMSKETQEHIFDPFFTTKGVGKGTGLGLATVYGIVKQNNGFVWVYSEPGQGSTFKVYLPKAEGDADSEKKQRLPVIELDGSETVLIVEDDEGLRKFTQEVLQSYGYRILAAENGEEALKVGKEHEGPIHLMITDVVMPKMGGKEAADRLQPFYPRMKVIYMSGYTDNAIVHHGVLAPGLNFLEKPFTPESLARKVREALDAENEK